MGPKIARLVWNDRHFRFRYHDLPAEGSTIRIKSMNNVISLRVNSITHSCYVMAENGTRDELIDGFYRSPPVPDVYIYVSEIPSPDSIPE